MFDEGKVCKIIKYKFANASLITTACTHASFANEFGIDSYDKLEFLGDSVLSLIVSEFLYDNENNLKDENSSKSIESSFSTIRAKIVCKDTLTRIALSLGLEKHIRSKGNIDAADTKILSDVYEAIVGAIYLDGGFDEATYFVSSTLLANVNLSLGAEAKDYKSELQEYLQKKHRDGAAPVEYISVGEIMQGGRKIFVEAVFFQSKELGRGIGVSKKIAQKEAAKVALTKLVKRDERIKKDESHSVFVENIFEDNALTLKKKPAKKSSTKSRKTNNIGDGQGVFFE